MAEHNGRREHERQCSMSDTVPETLITRGVGFRFRGIVKTDVEEYVSGRRVRMVAGVAKVRAGNAKTVKLFDPVQRHLRDSVSRLAVRKLSTISPGNVSMLRRSD